MLNLKIGARLIAGFIALGASVSPASASVIYNLTLSDPGGISGTGTLTLSQAVDPTNGADVVNSTITGLTFTIDRVTFSLGSPGFTLGTVEFQYGSLFDLSVTANMTVPGQIGNISLQTTTGFLYNNQVDGNSSTGVLTAELAPAIPEASTWAMMILGFVGLSFVARRRKQAFRLV